MTEAKIYDFATRKRLDADGSRSDTPAQESIRAMTVLAERHETLARNYRRRIGEIALRAEEGRES